MRSPLFSHTLLVLCLFLCGVAPTHALAQDKSAAGRYFEEGQAAYAGGDYGMAILKFNQAYQADPNGIFLYMISLAYLKTDDSEKALDFARRAQAKSVDLDDDMKARNMARIEAIELAFELSDTSRATAVAMAPLIKRTTSDASRGGLGPLGWSGAGLAVVGVGLMASSLIFERQLANLSEGGITQEEFEEATLVRRRGLVTLGSGAALTVIGAGLFIYALGSRGSRENAAGSAGLRLELAPVREGGAYGGFSYTW